MEIKVGQVWQNNKNGKFLILDTENDWYDQNYCKVQVLQDNEYNYAGHILDNVDKTQFNNMELVEEIILDKKVVEIRKLQAEITLWKHQISLLQDKIHYNEQRIKELK